jgi:hypothetical protein
MVKPKFIALNDMKTRNIIRSKQEINGRHQIALTVLRIDTFFGAISFSKIAAFWMWLQIELGDELLDSVLHGGFE